MFKLTRTKLVIGVLLILLGTYYLMQNALVDAPKRRRLRWWSFWRRYIPAYHTKPPERWRQPVYTIYGCTDPEALNYNYLATDDNGTCRRAKTYMHNEVMCKNLIEYVCWDPCVPSDQGCIPSNQGCSEKDMSKFIEIPSSMRGRRGVNCLTPTY